MIARASILTWDNNLITLNLKSVRDAETHLPWKSEVTREPCMEYTRATNYKVYKAAEFF